jgi:hypothetical protein
MIGLTYADGSTWRADDISKYMQLLTDALGEALLAYCWVSELQDRGAIHYHVLVIVRLGTDIPMPDRSGMWTHGNSNRGTAQSAWYIMKYASKGLDTAEYPRGARILGASWRHLRQVAITLGETAYGVARRIVRMSLLPRWLIQRLGGDDQSMLDVRKVSGSGWVLGDHVYKSPWIVKWLGYVQA